MVDARARTGLERRTSSENPKRVEWKEIKSAVTSLGTARTPPDAVCCWSIWWRHRRTPATGFWPGRAGRGSAAGSGQGVYLVIDGAVWLWIWPKDRFNLAVKTLDFHHARSVYTIAEALYGIGTQRAKDWLAQQVKSVRHGPSPTSQSQAQAKRPTKCEVKMLPNASGPHSLSRPENEGAPLGSGAVESLGKQFKRDRTAVASFGKRCCPTCSS